MTIGQVAHFLGTLPDGWLALDGTTYNEADFPELFGLLGDDFKDEILGTFTLPDIGGLVIVGAGVSYALGGLGGVESVTLTTSEIPSHTHEYTFPVQGVDVGGAGPPLPAVATVTPGTPTGPTGGGGSHENMQPYIVLVAGVFSGRF